VKIFLYTGSQQYGPLCLDEINAKILSGEVHAADAAWIEEWTDWRAVSDIPGVLSMSPPYNPPPPPPPAPHPAKPFPRAATIAILCFASLLASLFMGILSGHGAQPVAFTIGEVIGGALAYLLFAIPLSLLARGYTSLVVGLVVIAVLAEITAYARFFTH
jgi:hypothetical protein